jgi:glucokinase
MNKEIKYAIGIDIGGTNIPCALVNSDGKILKTIYKKTPNSSKPEELIDSIKSSIDEIKTYFEEKYPSFNLSGIGLGAPGALDLQKGTIITSPNLKNWKNIPIVEMLKKACNIPVYMDNDANLAAIAEHWLGAGKGFDNLIMLTLGTGIGGGIIINGQIYRGSHGTAGEIGHMTIIEKGAQCACGNYGCLEAYASANATLKRALNDLKTNEESSLKNIDPKELSTKEIYIHAKKGDDFSKKILEESGRYLGIGIASLANIFDPDIIIIGGGFCEAEEFLIPSAISEAKKRSFKTVIDKLIISKAKLGNDAGIIGAAKLSL